MFTTTLNKFYINRITGEFLPFKTQWTNNPNTGVITEFEESRAQTGEYEDIRRMVTRIKNGDVRLLNEVSKDFTDDVNNIDNDKLPLEYAQPEEFFDDITDSDTVKEYAKALAAEISERSAGNNAPIKEQKQSSESENGQASDAGASANVDAPE